MYESGSKQNSTVDLGAADHAPTVAPAASTEASRLAVRATSLGDVLVAGDGRTVYLFTADEGETSVCYRECAIYWPPLIASMPSVGAGLEASLVGTTKRDDGALQVTYGGQPLYFFVQDDQPGDVKGQGIRSFGGEWQVVTARGAGIPSNG
jgi:predicted lipoprotein with Yx(FWY)xxD motif